MLVHEEAGRDTDDGNTLRAFISAGNEENSHACMDIGRMPKRQNTPLTCSAAILL